MEFNLTTFVLEVINFIILVWVLARILLRPVRNILERRRQQVQAELDKAQKIKNDAMELEKNYKIRLQDWQREKQKRLEKLNAELAVAREKKVADLQMWVKTRRQAAESLAQQKFEQVIKDADRQIQTKAANFSSEFLKRISGAYLDAKLLDVILADLATLPSHKLSSVKTSLKSVAEICVYSAHPLSSEAKEQFETRFKKFLQSKCQIYFRTEPALIGGCEVAAGDYLLAANIRDELRFFFHDAN